jgi:hypothetical protein
MEYLNFDLHIASGTDGDYVVSVIKSPVGEASATLRFPYDPVALDSQLQGLELAVLKSGTVRREVVMDEPEKMVVAEFGAAMFEALFTGDVQMAFRRSQDSARNDNKGLRVRLRIDAADLSALPWEFLYDEATGDYMCLSSETPLVRYMEFSRAPEALTVTPPITLLAMIASPNDRPTLDVQHEIDRVESATKALQDSGLLRIEWMKGSTWRDLQRTLRKDEYHIFHFVGHGGFDAAAGEGVLAFTNESGGSQLLGATEVGSLLADERSLRLVVLNACLGAKGNTTDVFSSTSATLVRRGVPAVVAMQYEISDSAAIEFSRSLYEAIADGMPIDAAVGEARKAVRLSARNSVEWATPVLHMRSPDGVLFRVDRTKVQPRTSPSAPTPSATASGATSAVTAASGGSAPEAPAATVAAAASTPASTRRSTPALIGGALAVAVVVVAGLWFANRTPTDDSTGTVPSVGQTSEATSPADTTPANVGTNTRPSPTPTSTATGPAIARAYLQAVTDGSGATSVPGTVDYGQLRCTTKTVWAEDKCQALVFDGDDGKTLFMKAIDAGGGGDWRRSNIASLLPEEDLRRVLSDPRYDDTRRLFKAMSDPGNNWYTSFAAPGGAKDLLKQYVDAIDTEVAVARAYIQAVTGGAAAKKAGNIDFERMGCGPASVWDEDKCQATVLDGKDGKTLFMEMISPVVASGDWRQSNIYSLLPPADLQRVLSMPGYADTRSLFENMSDPNNDWYTTFAGPGGAKDVLRQYMIDNQ